MHTTGTLEIVTRGDKLFIVDPHANDEWGPYADEAEANCDKSGLEKFYSYHRFTKPESDGHQADLCEAESSNQDGEPDMTATKTNSGKQTKGRRIPGATYVKADGSTSDLIPSTSRCGCLTATTSRSRRLRVMSRSLMLW